MNFYCYFIAIGGFITVTCGNVIHTTENSETRNDEKLASSDTLLLPNEQLLIPEEDAGDNESPLKRDKKSIWNYNQMVRKLKIKLYSVLMFFFSGDD